MNIKRGKHKVIRYLQLVLGRIGKIFNEGEIPGFSVGREKKLQ